jgi:peptidoglycan hydrolase CwlO-like protein
MSENSSELINEYKEQIRILRQEVAELQDAGKSKDAANKRCLQKLEHTNKDLEDAQERIKKLEDKLTKQKEPNDRENKRETKKSLE